MVTLASSGAAIQVRIARNVCASNILRFTGKKLVCGFNVCGLILTVHINYMR